MTDDADLMSIPLAELREMRNRLQQEDDVISYVRRVAQTRVDLVRAERARRNHGEPTDNVQSELRSVLAKHLTGGPPRPPRTTVALDDHPLSDELAAICSTFGFSRIEQLNGADIEALESRLVEFERHVSSNRRARFDRLDELSAELVRRYRDGEASVEGLFQE